MNPIALGLIIAGMIFLLFGIRSLVKSKRVMGMTLSIVGLLIIAAPFVVSYLISR